MQNRRGHQIVYFDAEGRKNLSDVIRVVKQKLKSREELRSLKIVMLTAEGEGPLLAYNHLALYDPKIVAVTFPLAFSVKRKDGARVQPRIAERLRKFFDGVGISVVVPDTLPFDPIEGMEGHNQQVKLTTDAITLFGGGFALCIQAVLRACDAGAVQPGEKVIGLVGDCAGIFTASTTNKFLSRDGLSVNEVFCKARNLTIARPLPTPKKEPMVIEQKLEQQAEIPSSAQPQALPEGKSEGT
jgi:hypothetical protein